MIDLRPITEKAITEAGGGAALAAQLNLTRQAVYQWTRVPAQYVITVEEKTGISRHKLRPDIFGVSEHEAAQ